MEKILNGLRVLDFGRYLAGPFSGVLLADMGADVVKVEKIGGDYDRTLRPFTKDGKSMYVSTYGRNKRCITVDFRNEEGKTLLKELARRADVIINNFRPGVMEKIGIGYKDVYQVNPTVIYSAISGFGQSGKYSDRASFDGIATAMAGVMSCNWGLFGPQGLGTPIADITSGYVNTLSIMMALLYRERTGKGQFIDTAMVDAVTPFIETLVPTYFLTGTYNETQMRYGGDPTSAPANTFKAKDGYFYMHAGLTAHYNKMVNLVTLPEVKKDLQNPKYQDHNYRKEHAREIEEIVGKWIETLTVKEAEATVSGAGIPCSIVNTVKDVVESEFSKARENIIWIDMPNVGKVPYPGNPLKLSNMPPIEYRAAQEPGESNYEVYSEWLGLSKAEIERLMREKII